MSDGYINIGTKIDEKGIDSGLKRVKALLDDASKYYATLGKEGEAAFKKIADQIKSVDASSAITGDKIGALAEKKKILKASIESLISQGLKPEDLKVQSLQKAYDELTKIQKANENQSRKSGKTIKDTFADIRDFMQGPVAAAKLTKDAISGAIAAVKDLTDAYKTQMKAETQLESAARNNPLLDSASVSALKDYASELQSISTIGDEELLPQMAKLAAAGRTQEEIMLVMRTATDMAASGAFSLDSAVANLNKSYGGLSGELGESIPEIKSLTAEQLKNGEAVKLLAGRYKGIAEDVAKTTGTAEQLSNAMGDLKEELGAPFEKAMSPIRIFFTEIITGWANAKKAKRIYEEAIEEVKTKGADAALESLDIAGKEAFAEVESIKKRLKEVQLVQKEGWVKGSAYNSLSKKEIQAVVDELTRQLAVAEKSLSQLSEQYKQKKLSIEQAKISAERSATEAERVAALNQKNKDAADWIAKNTEARKKALEQIRLQAVAEGKEIDQMDVLNVYMNSYVSLVSESGGLVTENNQAAKDLLATTIAMSSELELQNKLRSEATKQQQDMQALLAEIESADERPESEKMKDQAALLDLTYAKTMENANITAEDKLAIEKEYAEKRAILEKQITDTEILEQKARRDAQMANSVEMLSIVNDFASQYSSIMSSITALATEAIENEAAIKIAKADEQFEAGAISAEEYEAKVAEIEKEAAKEKYKIDMWQWSSNILSAAANTALGVTQAYAQGGVLGLITGALLTAAGSAQIATLIANKPIPPSFATGGIVGGTSYTGDKVLANLNSKEMILNAGQQRNLFDNINSGNLGGGSNIKIYNSASNDVKATPEITEDGIKIMIRKTVGQDMADGRFNKSYRTMQNGLKGVRLTN